MKKEFLYVFGYEDPSECAANARAGTDFESSEAIRIYAESADEALEWGQEVSEKFIKHLFGDEDKSWKAEGFAYWIEESPDEFLQQRLETLPRVNVGEYPDMDALGDYSNAR